MIVGLSLRKNANKISQAKKELLIPAKDVLSFQTEKPNKYSYAQEKNLIYNLTHSDRLSLTIKYKDIIRDLRGKENNVMLIPNEQNKLSSLRETDYFELYFNSFLFEIIFKDNLNLNSIYNFLLQSLLHLNQPKVLFNKLNSIFSKYKIEDKKRNQIIKQINSLFRFIIAQSHGGKLEQLLEKVKSSNPRKLNIPICKKINNIIDQIRLMVA